MEKENQIQKTSQQQSLSIIKIGTTSDLLKTKPIVEIARSEQAKTEAIELVNVAVLKCSSSLGIDLSPEQIKTMTEDIFDVYKYDSVEDIIHCLKQARQGAYTHIPNYGKFNMPVFRLWMSEHLDKKYQAKEAELTKLKEDKDDDPFDRERFYSEGMALREELKKIREDQEKKEKAYTAERTRIAQKSMKK